jgi:putative colanic acid biosynthesis acetyltransferase WcaF
MKSSAYTHASWSFKNRLTRALWHICYTLCFRPSPTVMHAYRSWLLRLWGARIGKGCHIYPGARLWAPWNLHCEDQACVANEATLYNQAPIYLGYRAIVSQGAYLCTATHDYQSNNFPLVTQPIHVGPYAWIAAQAFVHPGATIAEGAVIGARSVVKGSIPAWQVCEGFPCVPVKQRPKIPSP